MGKIALIIDGLFEDSEYNEPAKAFSKAGHKLIHIGLEAGRTVTGKKENTPDHPPMEEPFPRDPPPDPTLPEKPPRKDPPPDMPPMKDPPGKKVPVKGRNSIQIRGSIRY